MKERLFAIGDIHGCSTALRTLMDAMQPTQEDTIVVLGDVVDWGPDSRGCVQQLIELSQRCRLILIRGNHEEMLLAALESDSALRAWLDLGGDQTLLSYPYSGGDDFIDPEHVRFLSENALDFHETGEFIFVHANYEPHRPMSEQSNTTLRWEHIDPVRARPHVSGKTVICGHTPQLTGEVLDLGFLVCIDTDCSRGGWLTGLLVDSGSVLQTNQDGQLRSGKREHDQGHSRGWMQPVMTSTSLTESEERFLIHLLSEELSGLRHEGPAHHLLRERGISTHLVFDAITAIDPGVQSRLIEQIQDTRIMGRPRWPWPHTTWKELSAHLHERSRRKS